MCCCARPVTTATANALRYPTQFYLRLMDLGILVSCYNCVSYDGNDCQTNICQGKFCIYERRVTNNQLMMRKSCSDTSVIQLDDGTLVDTVGQCEIRDTLSYRYYTKACNDANLCNNY
ncbi:unnamed protein product, partial [Nippostrongylus brasiliensis]|uniref:Activin_recp domain-containing protein n=1 Tax=Nippostrongylus brasiliensis TaxID=27835 RepID=A0A0N4XRC7_NIPBR